MPIEHREIRFSVDEVTAAVTGLVAVQGISSRDRFLGLRIIEQGGEISAVATLSSKKEGGSLDHPLTGELLCAALVRMSMIGKIPMPRRAKKTLARVGDLLELHLDFETTIPLDAVSIVDGPGKPKESKLQEAPATDWWVTSPRR